MPQHGPEDLTEQRSRDAHRQPVQHGDRAVLPGRAQRLRIAHWIREVVALDGAGEGNLDVLVTCRGDRASAVDEPVGPVGVLPPSGGPVEHLVDDVLADGKDGALQLVQTGPLVVVVRRPGQRLQP